MLLESCKIIKKHERRPGLFDFTFESPQIAAQCRAGQFLHIKCGDGVLLRRPISICDFGDTTVRIIFEVRGEGTRLLSEKQTDEALDVLGPLGRGFTDVFPGAKTLFIGGGIGIFPLLAHAKKYGKNATVLLGFKDKASIALESDFTRFGARVSIATDDGSYGHRGFVTALLENALNEQIYDAVFACGPLPMLKKTVAACNDLGIFCEISMEQRMGCGVGACLVCSCKTEKDDIISYSRVCADGPVFNSKEVVFDA